MGKKIKAGAVDVTETPVLLLQVVEIERSD